MRLRIPSSILTHTQVLCSEFLDLLVSIYVYMYIYLSVTLSRPRGASHVSELWSISKTELLMLERVHSKILRTIQGLPTRCPLTALRNLLSSRSISSFIAQRQLAFINSIATMDSSALPRRLLESCVRYNPASGCIHVWRALLDDLNLPSISDLLGTQRAHNSWKSAIKRLLSIQANLSLADDCPHLPIGACDLPLGKPAPHWAITLADIHRTRSNNFRIRLLTGCDGLEADASRFRRRLNGRSPNDPSCKLCGAPMEDSIHFVTSCSALLQCRTELIGEAPPTVMADRFLNIISGVDWIDDTASQLYFVDFLHRLRSHRNYLFVNL